MTNNETLGQVNLARENDLSTCVIAPQWMITVRLQSVKDARVLGLDDRQWANDERVRRKDWRNLAEVMRGLGPVR